MTTEPEPLHFTSRQLRKLRQAQHIPSEKVTINGQVVDNPHLNDTYTEDIEDGGNSTSGD